MTVWDSLLRVIVAFFGILLWSRLIGKKLVSHMTFFDFIAMIVLGSLGGNLIFNKHLSLWRGLLDLSIFSALVILSDYISMKSNLGRRILEGKPELIIYRGVIQEKKLKDVRLGVHDLLMLLRKKEVFYLDEIEMAYFETDGTVSVLKKTFAEQVKRRDLELQTTSRGLALPCIVDGKFIGQNLDKAGKDKKWFADYLNAKNVTMDQVLVAQIDEQDQVFLNLKNQSG